MADYHHGRMDIRAHERTYAGFVRFVTVAARPVIATWIASVPGMTGIAQIPIPHAWSARLMGSIASLRRRGV